MNFFFEEDKIFAIIYIYKISKFLQNIFGQKIDPKNTPFLQKIFKGLAPCNWGKKGEKKFF